MQDGQQRAQCLAHVGAHGVLDRIILAKLPVALADMHDRKALGHRIDSPQRRHAQQIRAKAQQDVILLEGLAHAHLVAGEVAHAGGMR